MKKEFTRVAGISVAAILLLPPLFIGGFTPVRQFLLGIGIAALGISLLWLLTGFVLILVESTRKLGQAFMLTAALLLLVSFTLCSTSGGFLA